MEKPKCELIGTDGNAFSLIAKVCKCLKKNGLYDQEKEFTTKAFASESYDALLVLIQDYVEVY